MTDPSADTRTLGEVFQDFLRTVRPEHRSTHERYVRHYVQTTGEGQLTSSITGARVEWYAEMHIKSTDPLADERVAALKSWFQYLKKANHTQQNFGTVVRVRRSSRGGASKGVRSTAEQPALEMTAEGFAALQKELEGLSQQVPKLIEAIALAREDKDFRENAPLDAAREALAQNESRRKQIESDLKRGRVVDQIATDRANVGSMVTVARGDTGATSTYRLVGAREANAREGKISIESPVGKELLGKRAGDEVTVRAPNGEVVFRIEDVRPA